MADINLSQLQAIPNQLGYLVLDEEGTPLHSQGNFLNDSALADFIYRMVKTAWTIKMDGDGGSSLSPESLCLNFDNFIFVVTVSNNRIIVVKKQKDTVNDLIDVWKQWVAILIKIQKISLMLCGTEQANGLYTGCYNCSRFQNPSSFIRY